MVCQLLFGHLFELNASNLTLMQCILVDIHLKPKTNQRRRQEGQDKRRRREGRDSEDRTTDSRQTLSVLRFGF